MRPVPIYSSTSCWQTLYMPLVSICALTSQTTCVCVFLSIFRRHAGYQMDVSWGKILYYRRLHIRKWQPSIWKAVLPGRLCTAQAVLKQTGTVGVAMTCVSEIIYSLNRTDGSVMSQFFGIWLSSSCVAHLITSPLGYCSSHIFHSGFAMERSSKFLQVRYYRYLDLHSTRHWCCKLGTSTWSILWCYGILYVLWLFYHSNRCLILLGCWILPQFQVEQFVTAYLWVLISAVSMIILYGILFASIHRRFNIAHGIHWHNQPARDALDMESDDNRRIKAVANSMLLLVYYFYKLKVDFRIWNHFTAIPLFTFSASSQSLLLVGSISPIIGTLPNTNLPFFKLLVLSSGFRECSISSFSF